MCLCIHNYVYILLLCRLASYPSPHIEYVASQQEPNQEHSRRGGSHHATESPTQSASTQAEIELGRPSLACKVKLLFWHYICQYTIF